MIPDSKTIDYPSEGLPWMIAAGVVGFTGDFWLGSTILGNALSNALARGEVQFHDSGALDTGPISIHFFRVADRSAAFACLYSELSTLGVAALSEIAWLDLAEDYWRSVHPLGASNIERVVTPENIAAAKQVELNRQKALSAVLEELQRSAQCISKSETPP